MTHFEYVAAAHTLILTFAAARILGGVANALRPECLYWVHLSWLSLAITFCLASFWVFWAYQDVEWTLARLMFLLSSPGLIHVFSSILVPVGSSRVRSWKEHFFSVRPRLFVSGAVMIVSIIFSNQTLADVPWLHASQLILYLLLGTFVVGARFDRPGLHKVLALVPPVIIVGVILVVGSPDWRAP